MMLDSRLFTPLRTFNPVRGASDSSDVGFSVCEKPIIKHYRLRLSGVAYNGRQERIGILTRGQVISLVTEPNNSYDPFAVHAYNGVDDIGYLPKGVNKEVFGYLMNYHGIRATVDNIIGGGGEGYYLGVVVCIDVFE